MTFKERAKAIEEQLKKEGIEAINLDLIAGRLAVLMENKEGKDTKGHGITKKMLEHAAQASNKAQSDLMENAKTIEEFREQIVNHSHLHTDSIVGDIETFILKALEQKELEHLNKLHKREKIAYENGKKAVKAEINTQHLKELGIAAKEAINGYKNQLRKKVEGMKDYVICGNEEFRKDNNYDCGVFCYKGDLLKLL